MTISEVFDDIEFLRHSKNSGIIIPSISCIAISLNKLLYRFPVYNDLLLMIVLWILNHSYKHRFSECYRECSPVCRFVNPVYQVLVSQYYESLELARLVRDLSSTSATTTRVVDTVVVGMQFFHNSFDSSAYQHPCGMTFQRFLFYLYLNGINTTKF